MVLLWIGLAIGVLVLIILLVKLIKTPPQDVLRTTTYCSKCGFNTNGLKCPRCEKGNKFGV